MRKYLKYLILAVMLVVGWIVIKMTDRVKEINDLPIKPLLPAMIGDYQGYYRLYCQNKMCMSHYVTNSLAADMKCPRCGSPVSVISLLEKQALPADTEITRKIYQLNDANWYVPTIVVSGMSRSSIHRPEQCIQAQGMVIRQTRDVNVSVKGRTIPAKVLELGVHDGSAICGFVYWFTDGRHYTASNTGRILLSGVDRIVSSEARRWGYVSIMVPEQILSDPKRLDDVIRKVHDVTCN